MAINAGPYGFDNLTFFDVKNPLFSLRISRVFLSVLMGAALASSGCALQALLQNPLADPYIIGVSGGSAIGGTLALVFFNHSFLFTVPLLSMTGAFLTTLLLAYCFRKNQQTTTVLLAGVAINAFAGAFITMVKIIAPFEKTQALLYWLVGNLNYLSWDILGVISLNIGIGIFILIANMGQLHFLSMGEEEAMRLGVNTKHVI
jgi:iron complex transport system permease protein